ncbi:MAG: hypothetical protein IPH93_11910 [Saprospiraceae bacterium]|nr:hypothetical protein [Saprospiraceae bacterium]MBK7812660.1 hypothetical protein [Saprospiraceae bacterium]MBK9630852.1 hypothetical protein [Saprospiraceae bacterium]
MTLLYIPSIFGVSIEVYFILMVLCIPTFIFCRWFFKKFIKVDRTRKIATLTATLIATPLIYFSIIMLWLFSISYHPTHDFDKEKWFADKETRYELSEDIIESEMLIGKTKSEVRQILGDEGNTDESDQWYYYLGFRPGFGNIDPDVLDIEFKDGKVINVGQHES